MVEKQLDKIVKGMKKDDLLALVAARLKDRELFPRMIEEAKKNLQKAIVMIK